MLMFLSSIYWHNVLVVYLILVLINILLFGNTTLYFCTYQMINIYLHFSCMCTQEWKGWII